MIQNEWRTINGKKFYFGSNGKATTGLATVDGHTCYFNKNGVLYRNQFITYNGKLYYMEDTGYAATGTENIFMAKIIILNLGWCGLSRESMGKTC